MTTVTLWQADAPPDTPHAKDDEFSDGAVSGAWTEWDPAAKIAVSETETGLTIVHTGDGANHWAGIHQDVISGDYAIWARVSLLAVQENYLGLGLLLLEDADDNPATSDLYAFYIQMAGAPNIQLQRWSAYNAWAANIASLATPAAWPLTHMYFRIRKATATYGFDYSRDGIGWRQLWSGSLTFTPEQFGIGDYNGTSNDHKSVSTFFRAREATPTLFDVEEGDRVKIYLP